MENALSLSWDTGKVPDFSVLGPVYVEKESLSQKGQNVVSPLHKYCFFFSHFYVAFLATDEGYLRLTKILGNANIFIYVYIYI